MHYGCRIESWQKVASASWIFAPTTWIADRYEAVVQELLDDGQLITVNPYPPERLSEQSRSWFLWREAWYDVGTMVGAAPQR